MPRANGEAHQGANDPLLFSLSVREKGVLNGMALGRTKKEIAALAGLSVHTVDNYTRRLFVKLRVDNRSEAVAVGMKAGLIS